jgi:hypothetical protein
MIKKESEIASDLRGYSDLMKARQTNPGKGRKRPECSLPASTTLPMPVTTTLLLLVGGSAASSAGRKVSRESEAVFSWGLDLLHDRKQAKSVW